MMMDKALARHDDRQLFGLVALESEASTPSSERAKKTKPATR